MQAGAGVGSRRRRRPRLTGIAVLVSVWAGATGCGDGLPEMGTVAGTVVDGEGQAQSRCSITRTVQGSNPYPFTEEAAGTDKRGEFAWEMYPGAYLITAVCPGDRGELRGISAPVDVSSARSTAVRITVA